MGIPAGRARITKGNDAIRKARASRIIEMKISGVPKGDIAAMLNIDPKTVYHEAKWAQAQGIVEEVQRAFSERLSRKALKTYEDILDMDANTVDPKTVKARELKFKAAKSVSEGIGTLGMKTSVRQTQTLNLDSYMELRRARQALPPSASPASLPPVDLVPAPNTSVEAELVNPADMDDTWAAEMAAEMDPDYEP